MKLFPDLSLLMQQRCFTLAYTGELLALGFGAFVIAAMSVAMDIGFVVRMMSFVLGLNLFLVWAWGRRYQWFDGLYLIWNIPNVLLLALLLSAAASGLLKHGSVRGGVSIGDGAIPNWGVASMLLAFVSRGAGLYWSAFGSKTVPVNPSKWPAAVFIMALVLASGAFALVYGPFGSAGLLPLFVIFSSFYGVVVFL